MKIGFFDSGIGGVTILKKAIDRINAEYIYLADNKNNPYGIKTKEDVKRYIFSCIEILIKYGCKVIVIACNTATSIAIDILREKYKNITFIGTEPALKVAVDDAEHSKILLLATSITVNEEKLKNLVIKLKAKGIVDLIPADKLVRFAEEDNFSKEEVKNYIKEILKDYDINKYSHIVLGCTHFPIFKDIFSEIFDNNIKIVDGSDGVVKNLCSKLDNSKKSVNDSVTVRLITTKKSDEFYNKFKRMLDIPNISVDNVDITE